MRKLTEQKLRKIIRKEIMEQQRLDKGFFSRIITNTEMQKTLRELRKNGIKVERWDHTDGYTATFDGDVVLKALKKSHNSYFVRFNKFYFKP